MRIKQLRKRHADLRKDLADLSDTLAKEERTKMSDEEHARVTAANQELVTLEEDIRLEDARLERERRWEPADPNPDGADPDGAAQVQANRDAGLQPVATVHNRAVDDPMRGFKSPRDFMTAVMRAGGVEGQAARVDERLKPLKVQGTQLDKLAAAGSDEQSGNDGAFGGFWVPVGMSPDMLETAPEDDPTAALITQMPMDNPIVSINARTDKTHTTSVSGGLTVSRKRQTAAGSSSRMEFEQVTLRANSLFGLAYGTEEILTDSPRSFAAILSAGFTQEFGSHMLEERLRGTGGGEPMGILKSPALVSVAKESAQTADTIVGANVLNMRARCWRYSRAIWLANHDTLPQLATANVAGTNSDVFLFSPARSVDVPDTLLGRPIVFTEYAETLGDKGDLILAVWSEYLWGTYQPMQSAESIHVRFVEHERAFKFWMRNDGQPWWRSAITPRKGANSLSAYVTLAARA